MIAVKIHANTTYVINMFQAIVFYTPLQRAPSFTGFSCYATSPQLVLPVKFETRFLGQQTDKHWGLLKGPKQSYKEKSRRTKTNTLFKLSKFSPARGKIEIRQKILSWRNFTVIQVCAISVQLRHW